MSEVARLGGIGLIQGLEQKLPGVIVRLDFLLLPHRPLERLLGIFQAFARDRAADLPESAARLIDGMLVLLEIPEEVLVIAALCMRLALFHHPPDYDGF
jgi:hypothetical protein